MRILRILSVILFLTLISYASSAVPLCCPEGQALLMRKDVCWNPKTNLTTPHPLTCKESVRISKDFNISTTGELVIHLGEGTDDDLFITNAYCFGNVTNIFDIALNKTRPGVIVCADEEEEIIDDTILGYTMIVSVIFLAITAIVYTVLPELRDVQGKSIVNFCGTLAIGLSILTIMKLMEYSDMALCATRGFLAYFFLMAAFFWTNAIAIQVLLSCRRPTTVDYGWREFKWYALYAWGCPTVLTVCMAIVNFHPGKHQKPGIGLNHCWFFSKRLQWYYMYSIISLLLAANIAIFIYTSVTIWRLRFSSSHLKAIRYKFMMTVRLIILMGLPWVFEMIGSLMENHIIWTILDIFNTLQGILIFLLLVVFRRRVIKLMYKHGWLNCISGFVEKHLAVEDDEENVVQHTDVPMNDRSITIVQRG